MLSSKEEGCDRGRRGSLSGSFGCSEHEHQCSNALSWKELGTSKGESGGAVGVWEEKEVTSPLKSGAKSPPSLDEHGQGMKKNLFDTQVKEADVNSAMQGDVILAQNKSQTKGKVVEEKETLRKERKVHIAPRRGEPMVVKESATPGDRKRGREEDDSEDMELDDLKRQKGGDGSVVEDGDLVLEKARPADRSCASQ